jgi:hypothetical protein
MGKKAGYFEAAEDMYVVDGLTLEAVAARLPVSVTSLSNWKQEGEWDRLRAELAASQAKIKRDSLLLREKLIKNALEAGKPQAVYAFCTLEATLARISGKGVADGPRAPLQEAVRQIKTPQEAITVLEEILELKLNRMMVEPELLTLAGIKDVKQCLELVDTLKVRYRTDEKTGQALGLSDEAAEIIRQQILGAA